MASRKHHTEASLPYFLPAPPLFSPVGTFGAFIKMKSPITTRKALVDIGASGPIAGFVLSVIALIVGFQHSTIAKITGTQGFMILFGDSIVTTFLAQVIIGRIPDGYMLVPHPVVFAGWFGLFVTTLNLIPVGQLDGGHILYAFLGKRHEVFSRLLAILFIIIGAIGILQVFSEKLPTSFPIPSKFIAGLPSFWAGWAMWGGLMFVLGLKHPPVIYWEVPLDPKRKLIGILAFIIFVITFIPVPLQSN